VEDKKLKRQTMNKSREGAALAMALVVVMVGSTIIAIIFNITFRHAWVGTAERAGFIDHATVLSFVQNARARILETNIANAANGITVRAGAVRSNWDNVNADPPLPWDSLIVNYPINDPANNRTNQLMISRESFDVADGAGRGRVDVTVFDMFFAPGWLNWPAIINSTYHAEIMRTLPAVIRITPSETVAEWGDEDGETDILGRTPTDGGNEPPPADPGLIGAYLIRAELFDNQNRLVRVAEEAFFQVLPAP